MTARAMLLVTLTLMAGLTLAIPAHGATSSPPSQVISTPVAHDDEHTDRSAPGANPAFWILSVAVLCLVAIALIVVIARYLEPFTILSELSGALESTRATLSRIQQVLDAPVQTAGTAAPADGSAPRIEFEDVTFHYGGAPVLDRVSFTLEPGTTTAIVGPSGSGKSTILSLIAGLHEPVSGRVRFGGIDLAALDPAARRAAARA